MSITRIRSLIYLITTILTIYFGALIVRSSFDEITILVLGIWWSIVIVPMFAYLVVVARRNRRLASDANFAIDYYTRKLSKGKNSWIHYIDRALAYQASGNNDSAFADCDAFEERLRLERQKNAKFNDENLAIKHMLLHQYRASLYVDIGDYQAAIAECDIALATRHLPLESQCEVLEMRAWCYLEIGDARSAIIDLSQIEVMINKFELGQRQYFEQRMVMLKSLASYKAGNMGGALTYWQKSLWYAPALETANGIRYAVDSTECWQYDAMLDMNERLKALS